MILKIDVFDLNITVGPLNVMKSGQNHITDISDINSTSVITGSRKLPFLHLTHFIILFP